MHGFNTMIMTNLKLLLRNKGFLAFIIILPILSVILLNLNYGTSTFEQDNATVIKNMKNENDRILNMVNDKLTLKVYDCSNTELSDYLMGELAKTGSYIINRYKGEALSIDEAREKALNSANHNSLGAIIYIPDTFEQDTLQGKASQVVIFKALDDKRIDLLENNLNSYLQSIYQFAAMTGYNKAELIKSLDTSVDQEMEKKTVSVEVGDTLNLNAQQKNQSSNIGFSLSFLTISFLFSGVFIAATVVEERQNRVYNRFVLSTVSLINYGIAKMLMIFITVLIQTGILALGIKLIVKQDYGISFMNYLILVFFLGLIFNSLSVVIGILANNILTSNYIAFLTWCMSCLLAGLYFPLNGASKWWDRVSMLMPQRWVVKSSELLMAGKSGVFGMFLLVVASYLTIIMCIGLIGIKLRRKE